MQILIDTREQDALTFNKDIETERVKLNVGDYGCKIGNSLAPLFFERKSLGDLYGTLSGGYKRFKKEINRASVDGVMLVLAVDVSLIRVMKGFKHSKRDPDSLVKQCFTLMIRHKVPCLFFKDSKDMAEYITQTFLAIEREHNEQQTNQRRTPL